MNKVFLHIHLIMTALMIMACQRDETNAIPPVNSSSTDENTKTLIVYYSYTNHTKEIVNDLRTLINADVIEVQPVDKTLNDEANNYAIGTEQLNKIQNNPNSESSYPAIDPVDVDMSKYNTVIIATPLWWSQMASNMQTFLFKYSKEMASKNIGLIVSSHSSGISGVEADAKRLVPDGKFMSKSLWINSSSHSQRRSYLEQWLKDVNSNDNTDDNDNKNESTMNLKVNSNTLKVNLAENATTEALIAKLTEAPITYSAHDYGGFEKVGALGFSLPSNDTYITTEPGDIMLYTSNQLCIFFDGNSWEYTRIGKIEGMTAQQLKDAFGTGEVSITLSLDSSTGVVTVSEIKTKANGIYALSGQKHTDVPVKGMYIENGVKVVK